MNKTKIALAAVIAAGIATPASATIVGWRPDVQKIAPPASVVEGALQSDLKIRAFDERQCFVVPQGGLRTDQGVIPEGRVVSSGLAHGDGFTGFLLDGKIRFDGRVLGVISTTSGLDVSDPLCGAAGTVYPTGLEADRGLESTQQDAYRLLDPWTIEVRMEVNLRSDELRAITECCPEGQHCD